MRRPRLLFHPLGLEVGDRALDGGLVVWVHGRGAPVGLCARHADKEAGDRLLEARQERRTQQVRLSERRYVL